MSYKVKGKITSVQDAQDISNGKYKKLVFVVSNNDGYEGAEKDYALEIFEKSEGNRIENFFKYNKVGQTVIVDFEVDCNEHKGNYYTTLKAFRIDKVGGAASDPVEFRIDKVGGAASDPVDKPIEDEDPPF